MAINLTKDYREFIELLNENKVEYLVVGAYAMALHGYVRNTGDIDIWIRPEETNAQKIIHVLQAFGFGMLNITTLDLTRDDFIIQLGYPPQRIDIITGLSGLTFQECWQEKVVEVWDGVKINSISLKYLRINKRASGRKKDLSDLEELPEN